VTKPRPPAGIGADARRFWREVVGAYELSPGELETLRQAVVVVDQLARADAVLRESPDLLVEGSMGQARPHPLLAASVELRRTLDGLIRSLSLPMPDEHIGRRRSPTAVAAAQARWREQRRAHG
jgi:hypothetical protein